MESWIAEAVGKMHVKKITQSDVAFKCGWTNDYVSLILLGKKTPKGAEKKILNAIEEIIKERTSINENN